MNQRLSKKMRQIVRRNFKADMQKHLDNLPKLRIKPKGVPKFIWKILYDIMFTTEAKEKARMRREKVMTNTNET